MQWEEAVRSLPTVPESWGKGSGVKRGLCPPVTAAIHSTERGSRRAFLNRMPLTYLLTLEFIFITLEFS